MNANQQELRNQKPRRKHCLLSSNKNVRNGDVTTSLKTSKIRPTRREQLSFQIYRKHRKQQELNRLAMRFAIESNNAGVHLLKEGNRDDAWKLFQRAFEIMIQNSSKDSAKNDTLIQKTKHLIVQAHQQSKNENKKYYQPKAPKIRDSKEAPGFVYEHGLMIQPDYVKHFGEKQQTLCCMVSSIILFNLGLVHHLAYLNGPCNCSLLDVALNLYKKADVLLKEAVQSVTAFSLLDIRMAIVNNMAVAYHDICRYDISRMHLRRLSNFIKCATHIVKASSKKTVKGNLTVSIGNGFFEHFAMNVMYLDEPAAARAA